MAELLTGAPVAAALAQEIRAQLDILCARGVPPCLAMLRVGARGEVLAYERAAEKHCAALGVQVRHVVLSEAVSQTALLEAVQQLNEEEQVHGILPLLPLPAGLDASALCRAIAPEKDVDGLTPASRAALYAGEPCFAPCTAEACMAMLRTKGISVDGKHIVVVGRSIVAGRPLAMLLLAQNATVTVCHSHTQGLDALCRAADILLIAAGQRGLITDRFVRAGQIVLDIGIHVGEGGRLCGDVDRAAVEPVVAALTPVPGGVGTVTNTVLAAHVLAAALAQNGFRKEFEKNSEKTKKSVDNR